MNVWIDQAKDASNEPTAALEALGGEVVEPTVSRRGALSLSGVMAVRDWWNRRRRKQR